MIMTTKVTESKFNTVLKSMSKEDKATVMKGLCETWKLFKEHIGEDDWMDAVMDDNVLRVLFFMSSLASEAYIVEMKKKLNLCNN